MTDSRPRAGEGVGPRRSGSGPASDPCRVARRPPAGLTRRESRGRHERAETVGDRWSQPQVPGLTWGRVPRAPGQGPPPGDGDLHSGGDSACLRLSVGHGGALTVLAPQPLAGSGGLRAQGPAGAPRGVRRTSHPPHAPRVGPGTGQAGPDSHPCGSSRGENGLRAPPHWPPPGPSQSVSCPTGEQPLPIDPVLAFQP